MDDDDIIAAMESTASVRADRGRIGDPSTADHADTRLWRDRLMRFFDELDESVTVAEIRTALEDWQ